jgi:ABC-type multidrug transport system fused ATPase/permease subunit
VPFVIVVATRYGLRARPAVQEVQQRVAELTADVQENVAGVRVVKAFAAEGRQRGRFTQTVARLFDQSMVSTRLSAFYQPLIGFLPQVGLAAILFFGGRRVIDGSLTIGQFTAFYTYLLMLLAPMRSLGMSLGLAQRATASGARLFEVLDRAPAVVGRPGRRAAAGLGPRRAAGRHRDVRGAPGARAGRGRPRGPRGPDDRDRRRHRVGQDDARPAPAAPLRRDRRAAC